MDWYRRYSGTCADPKIAETAMIAGAPRSLVIATWDALLESACEDEARGAYSITPRRIAAMLIEPVDTISAVLEAMTEIGMIADGVIVAWEKRQPNSATPTDAAERQRRSREARNGGKPPKRQEKSAPVTDCHGVSQSVTACHVPEGEEEEEKKDSSPRHGRERER